MVTRYNISTIKKPTNSYAAEVTNYLYDRQHVILETDGSDNLKVRYVRGINYIARVDASNKLSFFLYNGHGDMVQTVTEAGVVENQYDYDIFGEPTLSTEVGYSCAIRYAGEFYDGETGLYYLRARYYDPDTGRFVSEDSYWGSDSNPLSLNLYTFCENDPIRFIDPSGHSSVKVNVGGVNVGNAKLNNGVTTGNLRDVVNGLGGSITYNEKTKVATATVGGKVITYNLNTKKDSSGNSFTVSSDGRIQVQVRAFSESTGAGVQWKSENGNVRVSVTPSDSDILKIKNVKENTPENVKQSIINSYKSDMNVEFNKSVSSDSGGGSPQNKKGKDGDSNSGATITTPDEKMDAITALAVSNVRKNLDDIMVQNHYAFPYGGYSISEHSMSSYMRGMYESEVKRLKLLNVPFDAADWAVEIKQSYDEAMESTMSMPGREAKVAKGLYIVSATLMKHYLDSSFDLGSLPDVVGTNSVVTKKITASLEKLEFTENSCYKYLIVDKAARNELIEQVNILREDIANLDVKIYGNESDNERYKQVMLNYIDGVIYNNNNFQDAKKKLYQYVSGGTPTVSPTKPAPHLICEAGFVNKILLLQFSLCSYTVCVSTF